MIYQATIKYPITLSGIGLHSGVNVSMRLLPAKENTGICFRRIDINPPVDIVATALAVQETVLCTTLVHSKGVKVHTIEHFMSALYGIGVDNLIVEVDALEIPILDGSASEFIFALQAAGIQILPEYKRFIEIIKPVEVRDDVSGGWAKLEPYYGFKLNFSIDFNSPVLDETNKSYTVDFSHTTFLKEMVRARTFGFLKDAEMLRKNNMALGGSINNAIVLDDRGPINEGGLRFHEELVKHKVLDAVGDLYVLGCPIIGSYEAFKSGHALNNRLVRALLDKPDVYTEKTFESEEDIPINFIYSKVA